MCMVLIWLYHSCYSCHGLSYAIVIISNSELSSIIPFYDYWLSMSLFKTFAIIVIAIMSLHRYRDDYQFFDDNPASFGKTLAAWTVHRKQ